MQANTPWRRQPQSLLSSRCLFLAFASLTLGAPTGLVAQAGEVAPNREAKPAIPAIYAAIAEEGLEHSKVMDYLDTLTNSIGERLTGSDNFTLACKWAKSEFEKMGLEARLEPWETWEFVFNRGPWSGRLLAPENIELQIATEAWTAGTRGAVTAKAVRIEDVTIDAVEALTGKVEGKWILARQPSRRSTDARLAWQHLQLFAETEGAAGIVYSSTGDAKYPNRMRVFGDRNMALKANSKIPTLPLICVRKDQWDHIDDMVKAGKDVDLQFDIRNRFRREKVVLNNVIADLKGTEKPDEMVIVCGHLDSWHQATGTTDNGTGATSTMEAARILSAVGAKPKRTIRFILWGGEEQGLLGSRAYVAKHRSELAKVSGVFNHDTGTNWANSLGVPVDMYDDMERVCAPLAALKSPEPDYSGEVFRLGKLKSIGGGGRGGGGSDHASFLTADIPAWSWGLRGKSDYFQYTWHSQWDTYDVAIPEYQRHTSTVIATVALGVANLPNLLCRDSVGRNATRTRPEGMQPVEATNGDAKKTGAARGDANAEPSSASKASGTNVVRRRG
ncbi:MAG: M20/M25/M40 family metallo-hydrolase [Planctomycetes bacterium]|nr:M20/M25/M40 family metallo-hydrolase [Planctomycetota bacterium]